MFFSSCLCDVKNREVVKQKERDGPNRKKNTYSRPSSSSFQKKKEYNLRNAGYLATIFFSIRFSFTPLFVFWRSLCISFIFYSKEKLRH
jgi:hypothetical protein